MKVTLPQSAVDLLKEIIHDSSEESYAIRVYFSGIGCCGASFGIAFDEKSEDDLEYNTNDLLFIMDKDDYEKYGDVTISEIGDGFVITVEKMPEDGSCCGACPGCK